MDLHNNLSQSAYNGQTPAQTSQQTVAGAAKPANLIDTAMASATRSTKGNESDLFSLKRQLKSAKCKKRCAKKRLKRRMSGLKNRLASLVPTSNKPPVSGPPPVAPPPSKPPTSGPPPVAPPPVAPPPAAPPPCNKPAVAANERATLWGDPHVETADRAKQPGQWYGISYDIQEAGIFHVLKDSNLNINARFEKGPNNATLTKEAGVTVGGCKIGYTSAGVLTIDGKVTPTDKPITLPNGTTITPTTRNAMGYAAIDIKNPSAEFDITLEHGEWSNTDYMNIVCNSKSNGVMKDGQAPTGILGETFDADAVEEKATKNPLETYKRADLFA
jgi:hypothetical protein